MFQTRVQMYDQVGFGYRLKGLQIAKLSAFYAPVSIDRRHIVLPLSVCPKLNLKN